MTTKCFWMDRTGQGEVALRRYTEHSAGWTCADGWHDAHRFLGVRVPYAIEPREDFHGSWTYPLATNAFPMPAYLSGHVG